MSPSACGQIAATATYCAYYRTGTPITLPVKPSTKMPLDSSMSYIILACANILTPTVYGTGTLPEPLRAHAVLSAEAAEESEQAAAGNGDGSAKNLKCTSGGSTMMKIQGSTTARYVDNIPDI